MAEIVFLGTGGGRHNLILQERRTAGFCINGSIKTYVDPGPGSLVACKDFSQDPRKVDLLVLTHNHIDHINDAGVIAEAMSGYALRKKGCAIGSKSVIEGDELGDRGISRYHLNALERVFVAKPGVPLDLSFFKSPVSFLPTQVRHDDQTGFGFVMSLDGRKIGYTSDTEYFEGIGRQYSSCDALVINMLKKEDDDIPGHLSTRGAIALLDEARPKLAILTHLGLRLIRAGPEKEAEKIQRKTGVKTLAAEDGMKVKL
ncbi:MAG: MBL fold metallo-hydrolase [Candidatus Micrarchaeota archaeon]|nr:MBL fold metallo-hydrolase [Candidatus Micrarchaeota archaeon]